MVSKREDLARRRARLAQRRARLSEEQQSRLAQRVQEPAAASISGDTISPRDGDGPALLSFSQQRLWFLEQLQPGSAMYNIPTAVRLRGDLDSAALKHALNAVVRRHDVLRTTFEMGDPQPLQRVQPATEFEIVRLDFSALAAAESQAELQRFVLAEAQRPFNLAHGPLFRVHLLRLAPLEHVLVFNVHHIAFDGWSMDILVREFAALYNGELSGNEVHLPELPVQYADFAEWQHTWLRSAALQKQLAYWTDRLAGAPAVLDFPFDHPRPTLKTYAGETPQFSISASQTAALNALAQQEGVTLFMVLLAALDVLLYRYTRQDDLVIGCPIASRTRPEIEGLIGFFVNTLALRTDMSGDPSFRELLRRVRETTLGAYANQDVPFERLVEALHPQRNLSYTPLFQVMFAFQNMAQSSVSLPGLTLEPLVLDTGTAKFDMGLLMGEVDGGMAGTLNYNSDLFDSATITRFLKHWERLLDGIVAQPDARLSALPLLDEATMQQLLVAWNATQVELPAGGYFVDSFEAAVARHPDADAVIAGDVRLSYAALNRRVEHLAGHLQALGVGGESRVAVFMEPGVELLVSLLAIFKAGGVYVPLGPGSPAARLSFMLADAQVALVLTQRALAERLPATQLRVVCPAELPAPAAARTPLRAAIGADNAAYIIYTSGSTGDPKGVVCTHGALCNYLQWVNSVFEVSLPATTRPTFDASLKQLFAPLLAGRAVTFLEVAQSSQPDRLLASLAQMSKVGLNCVPSLWKALLAMLEVAPPAGGLGNLTDLLLGGEALDRELLRVTRERLPQLRIWNLYGPTEATANATCAALAADAAPTIGRPIANTRLYILDTQLRPVPVGVVGELYIGGLGVARGYFNRPALTAECFVPDPFAAQPGARLYRSGDLGRYLPDGRVDFLGRFDDQVKLRGFRIELGEIEAQLRRNAAVKDVLVLLRDGVAADGQVTERRLVAYVVLAQPLTQTDALRNFLLERLPDYMVPAIFVVLDVLPLLPNGKVDRRALPDPEAGHFQHKAYVAPGTPTESTLVEMWAVLLGVEQVGIHDNFFDLGGHSLLATQAISRIAKIFQVQVSVRSILEMPTIAQLAQLIDEQVVESTSTSITFEQGTL